MKRDIFDKKDINDTEQMDFHFDMLDIGDGNEVENYAEIYE